MLLRKRFIKAVMEGKLGHSNHDGTFVTLKEFKAYFSDVEKATACAFMPAATIEIGQNTADDSRFLFRIARGVYKVHPDALKEVEAIRKPLIKDTP